MADWSRAVEMSLDWECNSGVSSVTVMLLVTEPGLITAETVERLPTVTLMAVSWYVSKPSAVKDAL